MTRHRLALVAALVTLAPAGIAAAQSTPDYTADLNAAPARPPASNPAPAAVAPPGPQPRPEQTAPAPASATVRTAPVPAAVAPPASATPAPPAAPRALTRGEMEALPFTLMLPEGYALTAGRPGPDFQVWTVRKGGVAQLMIYAGPNAQFPIHDGELVEVGPRTTVVVVEDGRRRALEHLFRQSTAPNHIHVWIASVDGTDRDRAESIGHGVSPR